MKILFASSEMYPLISTGDLADFTAILTRLLHLSGHDIRIIIPAWPEALDNALPVETVATFEFSGCMEPVRILQGQSGQDGLPLYLVDAPGMFNLHGHPYLDSLGHPRTDNAERFAIFSQAVSKLCLNQASINWQPDVVHCNDWQTGLVPAFLLQEWNRPGTLFSLQQLSSLGNFPPEQFNGLPFPEHLIENPALHVSNHFSYLKTGLVFADTVTLPCTECLTTLAASTSDDPYLGKLIKPALQTAEIPHGIDLQRWNPATNSHVQQSYDSHTYELKTVNKTLLQKKLGLPENNDLLMLCEGDAESTGLLATFIQAISFILSTKNIQVIVIAEKNTDTEGLEKLAGKYPGQMVIASYEDETTRQHLTAGVDALFYASAQQISQHRVLQHLRYGNVPVIYQPLSGYRGLTGATPSNLMSGTANAFIIDDFTESEIIRVMEMVINYYNRPGPWWKKLATTSMQIDFDWTRITRDYLQQYQYAIDNPTINPINNP